MGRPITSARKLRQESVRIRLVVWPVRKSRVQRSRNDGWPGSTSSESVWISRKASQMKQTATTTNSHTSTRFRMPGFTGKGGSTVEDGAADGDFASARQQNVGRYPPFGMNRRMDSSAPAAA